MSESKANSDSPQNGQQSQLEADYSDFSWEVVSDSLDKAIMAEIQRIIYAQGYLQ